MVPPLSQTTSRRRPLSAFAALPGFSAPRMLLAPTRHSASATEKSTSVRSTAPQWDVVDVDRYRVRASGATIGFIDLVGVIYVALRGERYDRAVEISQHRDFADALRALSDAAHRDGYPAR